MRFIALGIWKVNFLPKYFSVYSGLLPTFKSDCWVSLFYVELYEFFIYFVYEPLIRYIICKCLLPFSCCSFILLMVSFTVQKLSSLIYSHVFIFAFAALAWGDICKKIFLRPTSESFLTMFSSRGFHGFWSYISCLIHFECILVYGVRK